MDTMTRSKVKSRSHHDIAHLHPLTTLHPDKLFPAARPPTHPDNMGENNTSTEKIL